MGWTNIVRTLGQQDFGIEGTFLAPEGRPRTAFPPAWFAFASHVQQRDLLTLRSSGLDTFRITFTCWQRHAAPAARRLVSWGPRLQAQARQLDCSSAWPHVTRPVIGALARETRAIPIVFAGVSDPIGSGFAANLAHPGGNITGFTTHDPALGGKWVGLLKEIAPRTWRSSSTRKQPCRSNSSCLPTNPPHHPLPSR